MRKRERKQDETESSTGRGLQHRDSGIFIQGRTEKGSAGHNGETNPTPWVQLGTMKSQISQAETQAICRAKTLLLQIPNQTRTGSFVPHLHPEDAVLGCIGWLRKAMMSGSPHY